MPTPRKIHSVGRLAPRIVTLDIETAPLEVSSWGLWEQNIGLEMVGTDWSILSFSAKWLDEKKVIYADTGGRGAKKVRDDSALLQKLWDVLDEADIVVTQNGAAFDIKKINARLIQAGFKPYSPIRVIDTKLVAQKHFGFSSNKLAYMTERLTKTKKLSHKRFPGFSLWSACLKDDSAAWAEMKRYNIVDTLATEELYLVLRPWITGHPNVAVYSDSLDVACPKCGGKDLQARGKARTQTGEYPRYQCKGCGGWARGRTVTTSREKRRSLLAN
jgi:predicted RNA-binding Zn-ribbon protein involved in translation (DUF1610 family)